jgi:alcohol dehydrogenase class IV
MLTSPAPFTWRDGERLIVFGRGAVGEAVERIGAGYTLLSTARAIARVPELAAAAGVVHEVGPGRVDELAGALRAEVTGGRLVAFGGGRVIDVAKALAAADPPRRVAAIPTTLSGGEMTLVHRHATGVPLDTPRARPDIVINDPVLSASQPAAQLAESAANALGHAAEGPLTPLRNPASRLTALESVRLLAAAYAPDVDVDSDAARDTLALAALLAGYVIGSSWYGMHHVLSQTVARFTPVGHGAANALMLPWSLRALRRRFPNELAAFDAACGDDVVAFSERLREATGCGRLRDGGVTAEQLDVCVSEASGRPELNMTPPPADADELRDLYAAAF